MKLVNIGFGSYVAEGRVLSLISPDSAPIKRLIQESRERGRLVDASFGRKTRSVLVMDNDYVVLSALPPETAAARLSGEPANGEEESL